MSHSQAGTRETEGVHRIECTDRGIAYDCEFRDNNLNRLNTVRANRINISGDIEGVEAPGEEDQFAIILSGVGTCGLDMRPTILNTQQDNKTGLSTLRCQ